MSAFPILSAFTGTGSRDNLPSSGATSSRADRSRCEPSNRERELPAGEGGYGDRNESVQGNDRNVPGAHQETPNDDRGRNEGPLQPEPRWGLEMRRCGERGSSAGAGDRVQAGGPEGASKPKSAEDTGETASTTSKERKGSDGAEGAIVTKGKDYASFAKLLMGAMNVEKQEAGEAGEVFKVEATGVEGEAEGKTDVPTAAKSMEASALPNAADETGASKALKPNGDAVTVIVDNSAEPEGKKKAGLTDADVAEMTKADETQKKTPDPSGIPVPLKWTIEARKCGGGSTGTPPPGAAPSKPVARPDAAAPTNPATESAATSGDGKAIAKAVGEIVAGASERSEKSATEAAALSGRTADVARAATERPRQDAQRGTPEGAVKAASPAGDEAPAAAQVARIASAVETASQGRPARSASSDNSAATGVQSAQTSEARHIGEPDAAGPARATAGTRLPQQVTDHLIDSAKLYQAGRNSRIEVRLSPPELGKVVISIRKQGNTIEGVLAVEKPETRRALEDAAAQVVRNLADSGVNVRRIQVVQTGHETGARADAHEQPGAQPGNQAQHEGRSSGSASYDIPANDPQEDVVAAAQAVEDGALNLLA